MVSNSHFDFRSNQTKPLKPNQPNQNQNINGNSIKLKLTEQTEVYIRAYVFTLSRSQYNERSLFSHTFMP